MIENPVKDKVRVAIVGCAGVPAAYGGFETLAENLVKEFKTNSEVELVVFCSAWANTPRHRMWNKARLLYLPLPANGPLGILYDFLSLIIALYLGTETVLLLGVSGAVFLPLLKTLSKIKVVTNVDGVEWRRKKWSTTAKMFLKICEGIAVRNSDLVIADNEVIRRRILKAYGVPCTVIGYGGDHTLVLEPNQAAHTENVGTSKNSRPATGLTICRIEPENNVDMILAAASSCPTIRMVVVGNWASSSFGRNLRRRYKATKNLVMLDPIYDLYKLASLRLESDFYVHGHSAGGTNPSLVEAMFWRNLILAFDCGFNRATTENAALFFKSKDELEELLCGSVWETNHCCAAKAFEIAHASYTWHAIATQYLDAIYAVKKAKGPPPPTHLAQSRSTVYR